MSDDNLEHEGEAMTAPPAIKLPPPPTGGYTADDLERIPNLPPHTELIDGGLFFVSPQKDFHTLTLDVLVDGLRRTCPSDLRVRREMSIFIGPQQRPEPDVVVVKAGAITSREQTCYPAEAVVLAVEVVSPDSEERDRYRKPQLYAQAGITHFWRVEDGGEGTIAVYVFELEPATKTYVATGVFHGRVKLTVPFTIDIDLSEIDRL